MKTLIIGSRSIKEFDLSPYIPAETEVIISGGASGIDKLAEQYADKNRISKYMTPKLIYLKQCLKFVKPYLSNW